MVDFSNIESYLEKYWLKYPQEKSNDPSIQQVKDYINSGGKYFLKDNIFILYYTEGNNAEIVFYWCDMKDVPLKIISKTLKNHKKFIKSLGKNVYSKDIKKLFDRDYLINYDEKLKLWRWS